MLNQNHNMLKSAITVSQVFPNYNRPDSFPSKALKPSSLLNINEAKAMAKAMEAGSLHDALKNTRIDLGGAQLNDLEARALKNPHISKARAEAFRNNYGDYVDKIDSGGNYTIEDDGSIFKSFEGPNKVFAQGFGDAYVMSPDNVWADTGNPGVLMHELGHAIDFNEYNKNRYLSRKFNDLYRDYAPSLWLEHAAWRKGRDRLLTGAAKTKLDPSLLVKVLEQAARTKPAGLGSYWGSGLGTLLGGAAGLGLGGLIGFGLPYLLANRIFPVKGSAMTLAGGTIGGLTGSALGTNLGIALGKYLGNRKSLGDEAAVSGYINEYADAYAKEHGIPKEEALKQIEALRERISKRVKAKSKENKKTKKTVKPAPYRKAANFNDNGILKGVKTMNRFEKAAEFGSIVGKAAAYRGISSVPAGAGPQQLASALNMFNQAKTLVDPTTSLEQQGLSREDFDSMIHDLAAREGDKYNFSELKQNPKANATALGVLGALGGGLAGKLTGQDWGPSLGLAAAGGLAGAGGGYLSAGNHNRKLMATAKVLKDYGLLKPDQLRSALPLLAS